VEIDGLSPQRDAPDEARRAQVRAALARHGVLCVRLPAALDKVRDLQAHCLDAGARGS